MQYLTLTEGLVAQRMLKFMVVEMVEMPKIAEKCREMLRNVQKCKEMQRNAEQFRDMQNNSEKCREM